MQASSSRGPADGSQWRPRGSQGWFNRFIHLAALFEMGQYQEAATYIQEKCQKSQRAKDQFNQHKSRLEKYGYDWDFGDE